MIERRERLAATVSPAFDRVVIGLDDGSTVAARLALGADGEASPCRKAAAIATETWSYPQVAIATRFAHGRGHGNVSTEIHRRAGPLTTVPLPGGMSSLVWVETVVEAQRLMGLDAAAFARELEGRLHGLLGEVGDVGPRAMFPLSGIAAQRLAANRVALVGEAGHRLPPIGAQGLNLGLRDAAWLAEIAGAAVAAGRDPGAPDVLEDYARARRGDVESRTLAVDLLNRSLIAGLPPLDLARSAGLAALAAMPWLRRLAMREGVSPAGPQPRLLRPL
jgi:2-octaprenyl-6-methoxyphenol hydroxylase